MEAISYTDAVLLIVFCPILLAVALSDMKHLRIPNTMVMAGLGLFLLCAPLLGGSEAMMRAAISVLAFVVCVGLFAIRVMGGGDAKMIPVVFLFIPSEMAVRYLIVFGWSLPLGMMLVFLARRSVQTKLAGWASLKADAEFPMGVSIALSGVIFLTYAAMQGNL
jgi:prepilin peptidase CpaA